MCCVTSSVAFSKFGKRSRVSVAHRFTHAPLHGGKMGAASPPLRSVEELSETIGWSWYQWRLFFFVGLCVTADSIEVNLLSFLSVESTRDWHLEEFWEDTVAAAVFMGEITGCFVFGMFADAFGRLPAFIVGVACVSLFGVASALSANLEQLLLMRFGVGLGIGGFTVPFDLLAETCPNNLRGLVLSALWMFWTFGSVALNIVAAYCLRDEDGENQGKTPPGWRWLTFFAAIPPLVSLFGVGIVDESPSWLATRGRGAEAKAIVLRAAATNGVDLDPNFEVAPEPEHNAGVAQLFTEGNWFRTLCLWSLNYTTHFAYYGVVLFLPRILGASAKDPYNFDALLLSCIGEVIGSLVSCYSIVRVSRRVLLTSSMAVLTLSIPIVLIEAMPQWSMVLAALVARGSAMAASASTWIVTPEGYHTEVRATGHSWGNLLARLGALLTTYWGGINIAEGLKVGSYVLIAAIGVVIAYILPDGVMHTGLVSKLDEVKAGGAGDEGLDGNEGAKLNKGEGEGKYGSVAD